MTRTLPGILTGMSLRFGWTGATLAAGVGVALVILTGQSPQAQQGADRRPSPTTSRLGPVTAPREALGFEVGDDYKLADWGQITSYFQTLDRQSDRIATEVIGQTTLKRPFVAVTITSPANHAKLARLQDITRRLGDPRGVSDDQVEALIAEGKSVIAITCSVHATEVAAAQMSMALAHRLATSASAEVQQILDNTVLILVPSLNPDGLDIVVSWYRRTVGTPFDGAPVPELYHHYTGHDNNRDWYMFTQVETRTIIDGVYKRWHPQVLYDVHQMGSNGARLFVPPFMDPYEPNIDPILIQGAAFIGQAMMNRLVGERKTGVVTNAIYDAWSPARAYQHYHGAVRILSEAASVRYASPIDLSFSDLRPGLGYDPRVLSWKMPEPWRGGKWRLRDIVDYELTAAMGALENMALYRERWLRNFYRVGKRAVEWTGAPAAYIVPTAQRDPAAVAEMLEVLRFGEVEIHRAQTAFSASGVNYPAGTTVIPLAQPYGSFAKALLERQTYPDLREYPGGPPQRPYDVVAHTLPLQMGVDVVAVDALPTVSLARVEGPIAPTPGRVATGPAHTYVLGHESNASFKALNRLLKAGTPVSWTTAPIQLGGRTFGPGAMAIPATSATEATLRRLAGELGLDFAAAPAPLTGSGYHVTMPRVGLYKSYVASMDEGWTRFVFESYELPFTSVVDADIRAGNLRARFDAIVLPGELSDSDIVFGHRSGNLPEEFVGGITEAGVQHLRDFVQAGGTLIALDEATLFAAQRFNLPVTNAVEGLRNNEFYVPGSLLRVELDTSHPLTFGMPPQSPVFFQHNAAFTVSGAARSVAKYPTQDVLMSGWVLGETALHGKSAIVDVPLGRGRIILMAIRPQFRAQVRATYKLLFNALYLSAAQPPSPLAP